VTKHIATGLAVKLSTGILLLDVEDAFLHKLLEYRFPMVYIKLIWSLLTDRKFYVTVAGKKSSECGVPSGSPQGAVLSSTLFNIFTSDFPTLTDIQLALFTDDSALFSTHANADVISDRAKYLGLILDKKLIFSPHFDYVSERVQKLTRLSTGGPIFLWTKKLFFIRQFFSLPFCTHL
jgi:hypothetical protein